MSVQLGRVVVTLVCWVLVLRASHEISGSWTVAAGALAAVWLVTTAVSVQRRP